MVQEIIMNPEGVRCLGNIVLPKFPYDFSNYRCGINQIEESIDEINMDVFELNFRADSLLQITVVDSLYFVRGSSFPVTLTLTDELGVPLQNKTLWIKLDDDVIFADLITDTHGTVDFEIPTPINDGNYLLTAVFDGDEHYGGITSLHNVNFISLEYYVPLRSISFNEDSIIFDENILDDSSTDDFVNVNTGISFLEDVLEFRPVLNSELNDCLTWNGISFVDDILTFTNAMGS